ncbi:polymer-forming cytoskeletal protein [Paenibacillus sp. N3/727]|uniref:polymer-forming cytoskeletal protein n=1 Tax=Paenibacillus sp. N3/727 TaxID=2925845 RepID=UPI001F5386CE|nr:polymer-forming cytoskeletal protein [Paenibacillus sp. N3/727]UNK18046.1 polymer-forming cytoskeletal protein [Paenibacillus sp. N3/727]
MEEFVQKRDNVHIAGAGKIEGGVYAKVQLDGMGTISGNLDCDDFIGNGSVSVKGALTAKTVRINGTGSVDGPMDALDVNVGGSAKIKSDVRARKITVGGRCHIYGKLTAKKIELSGSLKAENIQTESIEVKGGFKIDGVIQADTIEVKLYDRCEAREIYGDYITVRKKGNRIWEKLSFSFRPARLYVRVLEGNRVEVEQTEADIIRGNRIILGPGCNVRLVEYREELIQDPSAEVGEVRLI